MRWLPLVLVALVSCVWEGAASGTPIDERGGRLAFGRLKIDFPEGALHETLWITAERVEDPPQGRGGTAPMIKLGNLRPNASMRGIPDITSTRGGPMPEVSRFYGIVIRMYYDEHPPPHFHALYQGAQVVVRIDTLEVWRGDLPRRALALVVEWAMAHREELHHNWERAERGETIAEIAPLE